MGMKSGENVSLQQSNITVKQSGVYKVVATNKSGTAEHYATIKVVEQLVQEKPKEEPTSKSPKQDEPKPQTEEPPRQPSDEPKEDAKKTKVPGDKDIKEPEEPKKDTLKAK